MSLPTAVSLTDIPAYEGPHALPGIRFRPARAHLGVTSWGMNVMELDPYCTTHPEHDHVHDGQEELYVVLSGALTVQLPDGEVAMTAGQMLRVAPEHRRKLVTSEQGATVLALGGTPGQAFEVTPGM